ncbi:MAG: serine/threonine protein kinase [Verrucomicrobiaceae bacterium]|nr:serine/threonine protein kinase [Verrucomicrobiaceae bacterium]
MPDDPSAPAPEAHGPGQTPAGFQRASDGGFKWLPPSSEALGKLLPQYQVDALVGRGGMGAVYKGKQKALDRPVAIKILPPEVDDEDATYTERFKNEAKIMARLSHPAIVPVYDFGELADPPLLYFIMEFIDGTDVHQMIAAQGRLPPEHALAITAHVCDALKYAHEHGVVHRDIKPSNVLINMEGQVKVADFGLAKVDEPGSTAVTKAGVAMGTPDYVAPEALVMGTQVDARADIYAVGVMLYHMLTGEVPRGAFDLPSKRLGTDPRFDAIITKAMKMNRDERYQSSAELRRDLDVILRTPMVQAGGQSSAAIPKAAVVPERRPGVAKPARPEKEAAKGNAKAGANPPPAGRAGATPGLRPERAPAKSKAPLFIGIGAAAAVVVGAFVMMGGKKDAGSAAGPPAAASGPAMPNAGNAPAPANAALAGASAPPSKPAPIKVREEPKAAVAPVSNSKSTISNPAPSTRNDGTLASSPASAAAVPPAKPQWQKVEWTQEELNRQNSADTIQIEDGWYHIKTSTFKFPEPARAVSNLAVRYRAKIGQPLFRLKSGMSGTDLMHYLTAERNALAVVRYDPSKEGAQRATTLAQKNLPAALAPGSEMQVTFAVIDSRYAGRIDDTVTEWIADEEGAKARMLTLQNVPGSEAWVKDVEFIVLDGLTETEAKSTLGWPEPQVIAAIGKATSAPASAENTGVPKADGPKPARMPDPAKWLNVLNTPESIANQPGLAKWVDGGVSLTGMVKLPNPPVASAAIRATIRASGTYIFGVGWTESNQVVTVQRDKGSIAIKDRDDSKERFPHKPSSNSDEEVNFQIVCVDGVLQVSENDQVVATKTVAGAPGLLTINSPGGSVVKNVAWQSLDLLNPSDEKFTALQNTFLADLAGKVDAPFSAAVADLATKLSAAISRSAPTVRGTPAEAALRADFDRLAKKEPLPPADEKGAPAVLAGLRKTWHTELDKLRTQRRAAAEPLRKSYDAGLAALEKELGEKGDFNRAEKIKAARAVLATDDFLPPLTGLAGVIVKPLNVRPSKGGRLKMIGCFRNAGIPADIEPFAKFDDFVQVIATDYAVAALRADGSAIIEALKGDKLQIINHTSPPLTTLSAYHVAVWGLTEDGHVVCPGLSGKPDTGAWDKFSGLVDFSCGDAKKYCAGLKADDTVVLAWIPTADITWLPKVESLPKCKAVVCNNNELMILTATGAVMAWHTSGKKVETPKALHRGIVRWQNPSLYVPAANPNAPPQFGGLFLDRLGELYKNNSDGITSTAKDVDDIGSTGSVYAYRQKRKGWTLLINETYGEGKKAKEVLAAGTPISWGLSHSDLNPATGGGTTGIFVWIE